MRVPLIRGTHCGVNHTADCPHARETCAMQVQPVSQRGGWHDGGRVGRSGRSGARGRGRTRASLKLQRRHIDDDNDSIRPTSDIRLRGDCELRCRLGAVRRPRPWAGRGEIYGPGEYSRASVFVRVQLYQDAQECCFAFCKVNRILLMFTHDSCTQVGRPMARQTWDLGRAWSRAPDSTLLSGPDLGVAQDSPIIRLRPRRIGLGEPLGPALSALEHNDTATGLQL